MAQVSERMVEIPRFCVCITVRDNQTGETVIHEGFNTSHAYGVEEALKEAARVMRDRGFAATQAHVARAGGR